MSGLLMSIGPRLRRRPVVMQRRRAACLSSMAEFAVRRDWPDGSHEFVRSRRDPARAARQLEGDRAYWRRGPLRPELSLVEISRHEFRLHARHRRDCRAPDCARAMPAALEVAA
jgi:hypothetical protein